MHCPIDGTTLSLSERQGIEIDYCPQCRGVWLDRELDKLIERGSRDDDDDDDDRRRTSTTRRDDDRPRDRDDAPAQYRPKKKKKSFLSDMFEFGD